MIRRRRPQREIAFSFDSFLDVVANVVGIILRLILVAWVGARSYQSLKSAAPTPGADTVGSLVAEEVLDLPDPSDPLAGELDRQRRELAEAQAHLLEELRQWEQVHGRGTATAQELAALSARRENLEKERTTLERTAAERGRAVQTASLSLEELRERQRRLQEEIEALRKAPAPKQALRYRTPVSQPLQSEELFFECRRGRVTLIDVGALVEEIRRAAHDKGQMLRNRWEIEDVTAPVGPFRLHYVLERQRDLPDGVNPLAGPDDHSGFRYGLGGWEVVPVTEERGENVDKALAERSAFRQVIDAIDPQQTAVTFWVYPDSFAAYRRLRDFLHQRDVVVAGRPLPEGALITSSKRGTISRGQ
jgi:hypothetical protein